MEGASRVRVPGWQGDESGGTLRGVQGGTLRGGGGGSARVPRRVARCGKNVGARCEGFGEGGCYRAQGSPVGCGTGKSKGQRTCAAGTHTGPACIGGNSSKTQCLAMQWVRLQASDTLLDQCGESRVRADACEGKEKRQEAGSPVFGGVQRLGTRAHGAARRRGARGMRGCWRPTALMPAHR